MTRKGSGRRVEAEEWRGRLASARAFLKSAQDLLALADDDANGNPIMSQAINAAIAYADAMTIRAGGMQNAGEHAAAIRTLKAALGARADNVQIERLKRIISRKDATQYGHRASTTDEARRLVEQCERFAVWAETVVTLG